MMHSFPRTFSLPMERATRAASGVAGAMKPDGYLRLCREASGMTLEQVAHRLAANRDGAAMRDTAERSANLATPVAPAIDLVRALETPGNVARLATTLDALSAVYPFDPGVYRQLATEPADRHPRICRGCGCSEWDARDTMSEGLAWASDTACTRCLPTDTQLDDLATGCCK